MKHTAPSLTSGQETTGDTVRITQTVYFCSLHGRVNTASITHNDRRKIVICLECIEEALIVAGVATCWENVPLDEWQREQAVQAPRGE